MKIFTLIFFKASIDSNGHASDRIAYTELILENDNNPWRITGVNREVSIGNERRIVKNNKFWIASGNGDSVTANLRQYFVSSIWHNDSSPITIPRLANIDLNQGTYNITARVINREDNSSVDTTISIPVLTPPIINSVGLSARHGVSGLKTAVFSAVPLVLSGGDNNDMLLEFSAQSYEANSTNALSPVRTYRWEIKEVGKPFDENSFTDLNLRGNQLRFTHRELLELGLGLETGRIYEVFLLVRDRYQEINEYSFTRVSAGKFTLTSSGN